MIPTQEALATSNCVRITSRQAHVFFERFSGIGAQSQQSLRREHPECCATSNIRLFKPDAFFGTNSHDGEVAGGLKPKAAQGSNGDQSSQNPRGTIKVSAVRDGVEIGIQL